MVPLTVLSLWRLHGSFRQGEMFTDFSEQTAFPLLVHLVYLLTHKEHKMTQPYPVWRDMVYGVTCVLDHCYLSLIDAVGDYMLNLKETTKHLFVGNTL